MAPFTLSARQRGDLEVVLTHTASARLRCRAQALLWLAEGASAGEVAELLYVSRQTTYNWVCAYHERAGLPLVERLRDAPRPGRPRTAGGIDPLIAEGASAGEVAELLHVSRQTIYNWVCEYHERAGLPLVERLRDAGRPGRPRTAGGIDPWIAAVIDSDPRELGYRSTVWTAPLLSRYLHDHHRIAVCDRTVSRAIARLGIRWKRPRHHLARRPDTWRQSKGG